jgi:hypothetical protein
MSEISNETKNLNTELTDSMLISPVTNEGYNNYFNSLNTKPVNINLVSDL